MQTNLQSIALIGLNAIPVQVEADISRATLPVFKIVGLPDASVQEAKERVRSALGNSGTKLPRARVTVNLAPAHIKKEGSMHDLAMAMAILTAMNAVPRDKSPVAFIGELGLDGSIRPVVGALPAVISGINNKISRIFIPIGNIKEASMALNKKNSEQTKIYPVNCLMEILNHLNNVKPLEALSPTDWHPETTENYPIDFADIHSQAQAKRALEIAAAGGHNVLMTGPPGSGKTMLARALPSIMPPMSNDEALEVTKIRSVSGYMEQGFITTRPFRSPHHTSSNVALIGGGSWPRPGEVSLAHRGVLFLDELPEFPRNVLEALRQPLEDGFVTVSRSQITLKFPARFSLIAARNPCPCGYATDPTNPCTCDPREIERYSRKISGPLLDRIDLHFEVPKVNPNELLNNTTAETSAVIRTRVIKARNIARQRLANDNLPTNSDMDHRLVKKHCKLTTSTEQFLIKATDKLGLSARAVTRTLKVARTIADLASEQDINNNHLSEALQFRTRIE